MGGHTFSSKNLLSHPRGFNPGRIVCARYVSSLVYAVTPKPLMRHAPVGLSMVIFCAPVNTTRATLDNAAEILKTAVSASGLADASALAPYRTLADGFVSSLSAFGCWDKIWQAGDFKRIPMRTNVSVIFTHMRLSATATLWTVVGIRFEFSLRI